MKGLVSSLKLSKPGMSKPHRVGSASNLRGQVSRASSSKLSSAGGFMASRKKGRIKGSC